MGIKGLHAAVKHLKTETHLFHLEGITSVAVDASSFMMKGGVRYAREYHLGTLETMPWADYCLDVAVLLREHGMHPVFVFDGRRLPLKDSTCSQRKDLRSQAREEALSLESRGLIELAEKKWQQGFVLESHMEEDTMNMLVTNDVTCYAAEYESDQCMAVLWKEGIVDAVVTEDSDLLAYGVKKCIFKLKLDGMCEFYGADDVKPPEEKKRRVDVMLSQLSDDQVAQMCVLSGTDYNDNVPGVGIKKVYKLIRDHSWTECLQILNVGGTLLEKMSRSLEVFLRPHTFANTKWFSLHDIRIV